ncbi:MAG: phosphotransferase [Actinomycetia bacterium]|nr:phosphotransferase [Actinomycetes bacterium]
MTISGRDERRHPPGPELSFNEWWSLDYARDDGFGGFVRLALYPNAGVAWFWAYVVTPDAPGPIAVRDHEVPLPRGDALEVRADGLWSEATCETPLEHWTYGLEAFGVRLDVPGDGYRGEIGERMPVGLDLEWELRATPHAEVDRYEQAGSVHGEVLIGRERIDFDGSGTRAHGWGVAEPWVSGSVRASFQSGDAFALGVAPPNGYLWRGGTTAATLQGVSAEARTGIDGIPTAARFIVEGEFDVEVDVLAAAAIPLSDSLRLPRALCRFQLDDGATSGVGWAEWAQAGPAASR